jgi:membrane fusion protein (multidrug efflux system)
MTESKCEATNNLWSCRLAASLLVLILVVMVTPACRNADSGTMPVANHGQGRPGQGRGPGNGNGRPSLPAMAVAVAPAERGDIATYYSATASLDPDKQAEILARVNGVIKQIPAEEGDVVAEGQVVLVIDDAEYRHRQTQAEVDLEQSRLKLGRTEKMLAQGLVATEEHDDTSGQLLAAKAAWELATLELSYTRVRAPFARRVVHRMVDIGQTVANGTALFSLADMHRLLARVHVPARELRRISTDQPVQLVVDSTGDRLEGRIELISPVVDPTSGTIKVTVEITDYPPSTRPGDFAEVSIVTDRHTDTLLVPQIAVLTEKGERAVYIADGATAQRRVVEVGFEDDTHAEILAGIEEGEPVVVQGQRSLSDGQPLTILEPIDLDAEAPVVAAAEPAEPRRKRAGQGS